MSITQYIEDTKYLQWADGMYVMLEDLLCDYEKALVEDSLRRSVYFDDGFCECYEEDNCVGVRLNDADYDSSTFFLEECIKLTREQALYIATGDTDI
tara:strand:- start:294 stop:584 length:291 start_codon:yes stop_codon:yes gene_type:complete